MGYKAKNKQAAPKPLHDPEAVRPDSRRQNKRKAEEEAVRAAGGKKTKSKDENKAKGKRRAGVQVARPV